MGDEVRQSSRKFRETSTPSERVTVTVCWPVNYSCLKPGETIKAEKHFAGNQQIHEELSEPQPTVVE